MKCLGLNKVERGTNTTNNEINTCRVVPGDETENSIHKVHTVTTALVHPQSILFVNQSVKSEFIFHSSAAAAV